MTTYNIILITSDMRMHRKIINFNINILKLIVSVVIQGHYKFCTDVTRVQGKR